MVLLTLFCSIAKTGASFRGDHLEVQEAHETAVELQKPADYYYSKPRLIRSLSPPIEQRSRTSPLCILSIRIDLLITTVDWWARTMVFELVFARTTQRRASRATSTESTMHCYLQIIKHDLYIKNLGLHYHIIIITTTLPGLYDFLPCPHLRLFISFCFSNRHAWRVCPFSR